MYSHLSPSLPFSLLAVLLQLCPYSRTLEQWACDTCRITQSVSRIHDAEYKANHCDFGLPWPGGELFDRTASKETWSEAEARGLMRQLLIAVKYLHEHGIALRALRVSLSGDTHL